jgi:hypothetical protein
MGPGNKIASVKTWFQFPNDGGSFRDATTRCVGVGTCRKQDSGVMCPSYMATREEKHSTRGRLASANKMMNEKLFEPFQPPKPASGEPATVVPRGGEPRQTVV